MQGLRNKTQANGRRAVVQGFDRKLGRYVVRIHGETKNAKLKPENLLPYRGGGGGLAHHGRYAILMRKSPKCPASSVAAMCIPVDFVVACKRSVIGGLAESKF